MPNSLISSPPSSLRAAEKSGIWSTDKITFERLQKFWNDLPIQARQKLLRVDKKTLFEQVQRKQYCFRCNWLLHENFKQIVSQAKCLREEDHSNSKDIVDPRVHPWGGMVATKDGILTLPDCFIFTQSLELLQNVFDCARGREHERGILYPDACSGDGRSWTVINYRREYGPRESCALHMNRLSCDVLLYFWSALGEEARLSLLRMKEEDFIRRLMHMFDMKKFCTSCRRSVLCEFKELKELKHMRKELLCTSWFCAADTTFHYQVTEDSVYANWQQYFEDKIEEYDHFEWAVGTCEGKSDILDFEDVGKSVKVQVNGLDLGDLDACFITLRAWKLDGGCKEICVMAHALKEQPCVHRRLVLGDGYIAITKGESIESFFEYAEEVEEEEDDDSMDKNGNEYTERANLKRHARSPELAREFLVDAAVVIFKEQIEKAFREGTARQNAHCIFLYLALKLLEDKLHNACKEIITLEKQNKLLEEEENEKREEKERKERKRMKERERKNRKKEKQKEKRKQNDKPNSSHAESQSSMNDASLITVDCHDSVSHLKVNISSEDSEVKKVSNDNLIFDYHAADKEFNSGGSSLSYVVEQSHSSKRNVRENTDFYFGTVSKWYGNNAYPDEFDTKISEGNNYTPSREKCFRAKTSRCDNSVIKKHEYTANRSYRTNAKNRVWVQRSNSSPDVITRTPAISNKTKIYNNISQVNNSNNERDGFCGNNRKISVDCGNPITNLSGLCLSEGDITDSSCSDNQNIELFSITSNSEDLTSPQFDENTSLLDQIRPSGSENLSFAQFDEKTNVYDQSRSAMLMLIQNRIKPPVQVPNFAGGYPNQTPVVWQSPLLTHYNHHAYPPSPFKFNEFNISCNPVHFATPFYNVPIHTFSSVNNGVYVSNHVKESKYTTEKSTEKQTEDRQKPSKSKSGNNQGEKPFSLFHYDSPLAGLMSFESNDQFDKADENTTMKEYSLFSGSRFLIF